MFEIWPDLWQILPSIAFDNIDLSIEGMRSQKFSFIMFWFLMFGIAFFSFIVMSLVFGTHAPGKMRTGEKFMFGAIFVGIVVAIALASVQMLQGYLF